MGRQYRVISASGYAEVPAEMWVRQVASKFRDKTPKLVRHEDGSEWWHLLEFQRDNLGNVYDDQAASAGQPSVGRSYHHPDGSPRPGSGTGTQRLREQDQDGIDAEVLYPPGYLVPFMRPLAQRDKEAYLAIVRAYNTFLGEEYCAIAPDRLIGSAIVPETGLENALSELERCRKMGLKSANLSMWPNGGPAFRPEDDRFFAAALDMDARVTSYPGIGIPPGPPDRSGGLKRISELTDQTPGLRTSVGGSTGVGGIVPSNVAQLLTSQVFDRLPKLQIFFPETQGGWLPYYLSMMDEGHQRNLAENTIKLKGMPTDYVRDHVRFGFTTDRMAVKYRQDIGLDVLMWGSGFPHGAGTFPHSGAFLDEVFAGVPEAERRQILVENPCRFFGLDPKKELTPTP